MAAQLSIYLPGSRRLSCFTGRDFALKFRRGESRNWRFGGAHRHTCGDHNPAVKLDRPAEVQLRCEKPSVLIHSIPCYKEH